MLGHAEFTAGDYLAILRRRIWLIAIPLVVGPLAGYGISLLFAPRYTSQSLILIEQPKVPENFVPSVVTTDLFERLSAMEGQILSRTRLQPIVERYGLYHDLVLIAPVGHLEPAGGSDRGVGDLPVAADLVVGIHDDDARPLVF